MNKYAIKTIKTDIRGINLENGNYIIDWGDGNESASFEGYEALEDAREAFAKVKAEVSNESVVEHFLVTLTVAGDEGRTIAEAPITDEMLKAAYDDAHYTEAEEEGEDDEDDEDEIVEGSILNRLGWFGDGPADPVVRWDHQYPVESIKIECRGEELDEDIDSQVDWDPALWGDVDVRKEPLSDIDWENLLTDLQFGDDDHLINPGPYLLTKVRTHIDVLRDPMGHFSIDRYGDGVETVTPFGTEAAALAQLPEEDFLERDKDGNVYLTEWSVVREESDNYFDDSIKSAAPSQQKLRPYWVDPADQMMREYDEDVAEWSDLITACWHGDADLLSSFEDSEREIVESTIRELEESAQKSLSNPADALDEIIRAGAKKLADLHN